MGPWQAHSSYQNFGNSVKWASRPRFQWFQFWSVGKCSVRKGIWGPYDHCGSGFCNWLEMSALDSDKEAMLWMSCICHILMDFPFSITVFSMAFIANWKIFFSFLVFLFSCLNMQQSLKTINDRANTSKQYSVHLLQRDQTKQIMHGREVDLYLSHL